MWRAMQHKIYLLLLSLSVFLKPHVAQEYIARPGCNHTCGNVNIPFPFGIGSGCFHDPWFEIECKASCNSNGSNKPFLSKSGFEVMEVNLDALSVKVGLPQVNACTTQAHTIDLRPSPYEISLSDNVFVMEGCPSGAVMLNESKAIMAGCATVCKSNYNDSNVMQTNNCYGDQCCQSWLNYDSPLKFYRIEFSDHQSSGHDCFVAGLTYVNPMSPYYAGGLLQSNVAPVVLAWSFQGKLPRDMSVHAICGYQVSETYQCSCEHGYYGNPYVPNGCRVARECMDCQGYCYGEWDIEGNLLEPGSSYCVNKPILKLAAVLGLSISFGILVLLTALYGLYRFVRKRREMKQRAKSFERNGGLLLQQQLSSSKRGSVERTMIFSLSEISKATNHFDENRILGQGGQGTVYKGMLVDGRIVAIKKSKKLDESQLEQFINEVVILSQINHRNVVKLLGCCLETEVPLLVYEFVPIGTLFQHIHVPDEDFVINWEMRLKIATDSATAIAYLHSSSSIPVYHRDIKSSNILLDEKYAAKVSDFGSSKTIAVDQTHMTTLVQGTLGYLDPEYFKSYKFTEKSDVYSFGVVLLELLTGKKSIYLDGGSMEQKNLVTEFLFLSETSKLCDILDPMIVRDATKNELISFIELAKRCISSIGKVRPTMKEVAMTLEMIMKSPSQVSRWYQEQEAFPIPNENFDGLLEIDLSDVKHTCTHTAGVSSPLYV